MLLMIEGVLRNEMPSLKNSLLVRTALLHNHDVYAPVNLRKNLQGAKLDVSEHGAPPHTSPQYIVYDPPPGT